MPTSPQNLNTRQFWDGYFRTEWEKNNGREQTRLFARYFLNTVTLPPEAKSFLDLGCAMGDALPEVHKRYPHLKLYGFDVSPHSLEIAKRDYGDIATFEERGFDELKDKYDIILCSNIFEHFENYLDIVRGILGHSRWLYVMCPYMELHNGKRLTVVPGQQHVVTFDKRSFNALKRTGPYSVKHWIIHTPGAWGTGPVSLREKLVARLRKQPVPVEYRQIIYRIERDG